MKPLFKATVSTWQHIRINWELGTTSVLGCASIKSESLKRIPRHQYLCFVSSSDDSYMRLCLRISGVMSTIPRAATPPVCGNSDSALCGCFPSARPGPAGEPCAECTHNYTVQRLCCFTVPLIWQPGERKSFLLATPQVPGWMVCPQAKKQLVVAQGPKPSR